MLGGLYGDLPPPSSSSNDENTTTNVWSSSAKMAPATLRKPFAPPQTILRPKPPQAKPIPKPEKPNPNSIFGSATSTTANMTSSSSFQPALVAVTSTVIEEYDPARPNDYEEYRRERKRKQDEAQWRKELEERERREREREERERKERDRERDRELSISGEEAWRRRAAMGGGGNMPRSPSPPNGNGGGNEGFRIGKSESSGLGLGAEGKMTAAQRMMAKMGWKEGQGLGKQEQGITTPLVAKKTDKRAGVIVNASDSGNNKKVKSVSFNGPPTKVVLLRNMVGPGEVDDELEGEVAEECTKFGTVTRVLIFEITEPNFPPEEAVRIFIQFERAEQATKALIELEGRFFGGRTVRGGFYDEERFSKNELAPLPGEIPGF